MFKKITFTLIFLLLSFYGFSQKDSIKLGNNEILIGEIKSMDKSVLVFKTSYSDSNFKVKWWKVKEIYSKRQFILTLLDGRRLNTTIHTDSLNKKNVILNSNGQIVKTSLNKITSLDQFTSGSFFERIELAFDAGFSLTKANNFQKLSINAKIAYQAAKWNFLNTFNLVYSKQDNTDNIRRYEDNLSVQRFLNKDWYLSGSVDLLSSSDQQIELRTTGSLGAGYFIKKTNSLYFGTGAGLAYNNETYAIASDDKSSMESYLGIELNKYDIGDFSVLTSATFSPSITEKGRVRFDFKFNLKYDITSSIYINSGLTYNFDNQSATGAPNSDYTFQTTLGWDFN